MANIAQMVNVLQSMIRTDGPRMLLTPTYYVYRMYVPFQGAKALPVQVDAGRYAHDKVTLPRLDAIAARAPDGRLWLAAVNLDPGQVLRLSARIDGAAVHAARGEVLTAAHVDAVNSFAQPREVVPQALAADASHGELIITLPAKSVAVLQIN
jgi:alpha-N-arabinofuranosidase